MICRLTSHMNHPMHFLICITKAVIARTGAIVHVDACPHRLCSFKYFTFKFFIPNSHLVLSVVAYKFTSGVVCWDEN